MPVVADARTSRLVMSIRYLPSRTSVFLSLTVVRDSVVCLVRDGLLPKSWARTGASVGARDPHPIVRMLAPAYRELMRVSRLRALAGGRRRWASRTVNNVTVDPLPWIRHSCPAVERDAAGPCQLRVATPRSDDQPPPAGADPVDRTQPVPGRRRNGRMTLVARRGVSLRELHSPMRCSPMIWTVMCAKSCCHCRKRPQIWWHATW